MVKPLINDARAYLRGEWRNVSISVEDGIIKTMVDLPHNPDAPLLLPGLVDLHVHARDPGFPAKEDLFTCAAAARAGGFSDIAVMPNTSPVCDTPELVRYILQKSADFSVRVHPISAITVGEMSEQLVNMEAMADAGAMAFSDDGHPVKDDDLMREALVRAKKLGKPILAHSEDERLSAGGCINQGKVSALLGLRGIPNEAEIEGIRRDISLCRETGAPLHLCHVSTSEGFALVREAKKEGLPVTAETCPHYFALTEDILLSAGSYGKIMPPLRTEEDRLAVIEAIADGTCDIISTDHAPHTRSDKYRAKPLGESLRLGAFGITGLETAFALSYTYLVRPGYITEKDLIRLLCTRPREILGLKQAKIDIGKPFCAALFDVSAPFVFSARDSKSRSKNTPFDGFELYGKYMECEDLL
ncbi:MAG: dihydroorotase [Clostridia bacterium]|nr:dihydroorotase [Clostridia bacterium]